MVVPLDLRLALRSPFTRRWSLRAEELIAETRARAQGAPDGRAHLAACVLAVAFLAAAAACLAALPPLRHGGGLAPLWIAIYAVVSRVEFEVGRGAVIPTQLVLVPMLFALPLDLVPLCVAAGLLVRQPLDLLRGRVGIDGCALALLSSWHAVGPALVLALAHTARPEWTAWPVYAGALAAQWALDFGTSSLREWYAFGESPRSRIAFMRTVYGVDLALMPAGVLVAIAVVATPWSILAVLPLVGLLAVFGRERSARITQALELSRAYRGTALLLVDVIEAEDAYTGRHSRDVLSLSLAVADRLGLSDEERRELELTALLHDVGKIRIPAELIRKPGPLTAEERRLVETHSVEGERLLQTAGGLVGEVGRFVRSCHERWDGGGYPDRLVGDETPLVARVVACCDAFHAMTTDRTYRRALPVPAAVDELRREAGRQFDPQVVDALVDAVEEELPVSAEAYLLAGASFGRG